MAKILVVDDEKMIATVLTKVFLKAGHEVKTLNSGLEAIQWLQNPNDTDLSLAMLDLLMPELSGAEVLDWIHTNRKSTKVIMMTAYGDPEVRADLMRRGASMILSKPFDDIFSVAKIVNDLIAAN